MQAFSIPEPYVKDFMQHLFFHDTFVDFEVRGIVVHSFTYFEISGERSRLSEENVSHCTWDELRPYVRHIIKGKEKPRSMKIIFARSIPETLHPNAAALFINMTYEGDKLTCTTATSQKQFDLDRKVDTEWDSWVTDFFKQKGIIAVLT